MLSNMTTGTSSFTKHTFWHLCLRGGVIPRHAGRNRELRTQVSLPCQSPTRCPGSCRLLNSGGTGAFCPPLCFLPPPPRPRNLWRARVPSARPSALEAPLRLSPPALILISISRAQGDFSAPPAQLPLEEPRRRSNGVLPPEPAEICVALVTANDISPSAGSSVS